MRLNINNIGRVDKADIEIRRITVVAGENATGKSTVSKSLYALLEMSRDSMVRAEVQKRRSFRNCVISWKEKNMPVSRIAANAFLKNVETYYGMAEESQEQFLNKMMVMVKESLSELFWDEQIMEDKIRILFRECSKIANRDLGYYCNYLAQVMLSDVFNNQVNCLKNNQEGVISYANEQSNTQVRILGHKIVHMDVPYDVVAAKPIYVTTPDLMDAVGTYKKLYSAERSGRISYVDSQLTKLLMEEPTPGQFVAEEYNEIEEQKQKLQGLFTEVVEGELYLEGSRLVYNDRWCDNKIELSNIASGMKIFLILQCLTANGTFLEDTCLIIDEPETNLHPEWQLKLAHLLVLLNMNLGVRVYLNSHSPYFVRAIEFYANKYQILEQCNFYIMKKDALTGMSQSKCVTDKLGIIYDQMAEPFNMIM